MFMFKELHSLFKWDWVANTNNCARHIAYSYIVCTYIFVEMLEIFKIPTTTITFYGYDYTTNITKNNMFGSYYVN